MSPWFQIAANLPQINLPMVLKVKRVKIQYVKGRELSKSQFSWQSCQATGFKGVRTEQDFERETVLDPNMSVKLIILMNLKSR